MPYGAEFLTLLRDYHAMIVATTGDEQSRVIYDANSRAVPVIATDTPGNRDVVFRGQAGCLLNGSTAQIWLKPWLGWQALRTG
ncbi:glycosyltransferase [Paracoccus litorisediminis]|jgi:glycosyltransferase involved in cell wall biosynthesis|uniref:glycosyltransferase n=1 Tax=Paracoccus litorisediminis TaxID=2006130 RepID=UPI003730A8A1